MKPFARKTRSRILTTALVTLLLLGTSVVPTSAEAVSLRRIGEVTFDVAVLRPLWTATFLSGCILLAPALAISSPGGSDAVRDAKEVFFDRPYKQAFERPLGEF